MFRTPIEITESKDKLDYTKGVVLIGSCFSENIGSIMKDCRFPVTINPFGILFNPESIAICLDKLIGGKSYSADDLSEFNQRYYSWQHHGRFSDKDIERTLENINTELLGGHQALKEADTLILTFGTSWAYQLIASGDIVGNCHKVPQASFNKVLISHTQIEKRFDCLIEKLNTFNPNLKIILSVSPVRHWKDGAQQNNISKGHLHIATQALCEKHTKLNYFPSYEIVMDELRDYRFFKEDMLHPSPLATEFVWEKFSASFFDDKTLTISSKVRKLSKVFNHKAEDEKKHEELIKSTKEKIKKLIFGQ